MNKNQYKKICLEALELSRGDKKTARQFLRRMYQHRQQYNICAFDAIACLMFFDQNF